MGHCFQLELVAHSEHLGSSSHLAHGTVAEDTYPVLGGDSQPAFVALACCPRTLLSGPLQASNCQQPIHPQRLHPATPTSEPHWQEAGTEETKPGKNPQIPGVGFSLQTHKES